MTATHVCLISDQPIPNLLPLLLEKPTRAIFLVSPEMAAQAERLKKVTQPHGIKIDQMKIAAYDIDAVDAVCQKILAESGDGLTLNVTGGTKIAALAAFQAFFFDNKRIIYCDTEHDQLIELAPKRRTNSIDTNRIKVRDYLACYGIPQVAGGEPPGGSENRRAQLAKLAGLLVGNEKLLSRLNAALDSQQSQQYANISLNALGENTEALTGLLARCGVAAATGAGNLNIPSEDKLFFCKGGWLEEYAYWTVRNLQLKGLDAAINVKVKWDGQGRQTTENEFDVLFTHRNRLHIISCKAANPDRETSSGTRATEALNELDALKDRAGGLFGRAMLVSARRLSPFDRERAKKMRIELVDGQEVLQLDHRLRSWLNPSS